MKRFLPFLPPVLLCLVAFLQVYLVRAHDLSPWKGGGFGMFSTNDDEARRIEVWVIESEGERQIDVSRDMRVLRIATFPTDERLIAMGRKIGEVQRAQGAEVKRVRVAAWRRDFVLQTMEPRQVLIREVVVDLERPSSR